MDDAAARIPILLQQRQQIRTCTDIVQNERPAVIAGQLQLGRKQTALPLPLCIIGSSQIIQSDFTHPCLRISGKVIGKTVQILPFGRSSGPPGVDAESRDNIVCRQIRYGFPVATVGGRNDKAAHTCFIGLPYDLCRPYGQQRIGKVGVGVGEYRRLVGVGAGALYQW